MTRHKTYGGRFRYVVADTDTSAPDYRTDSIDRAETYAAKRGGTIYTQPGPAEAIEPGPGRTPCRTCGQTVCDESTFPRATDSPEVREAKIARARRQREEPK